jgi:hypothetical protein
VEHYFPIAAIAHVEMKTKQDQEELGTKRSKLLPEACCQKGLLFAVFLIFQHAVIFKVGYGRVPPSYYR